MAKRMTPRQRQPRETEPSPARPEQANDASVATLEREPETEQPSAGPDDDEIARRAYEIYCERGCEHGRDMDDWLRAENELKGR